MHCGFAAALFAGASAAVAQEVWFSSASGNWSTDVRWLDGSAPVIGGGDTLQVAFRGSGSSTTVATNDRGAFRLNQLAFDWGGNGTVLIDSATGSELQFVGANPTIQVLGSGSSAISSPALFGSPSDLVTIGGTGTGTLTWSGNIREGGSPQALLIDASGAQVTLNGNNTFTGGVTLKTGTLAIGSSSALGSGALSVSGGALRIENGVTVANPISLAQTLVVTGAGTSTGGTLSGLISGSSASAGLALRTGSGTLRIAGPTTFTGLTTIEGGSLPSTADTTATLRLMGNGTLQGTSGIEVRAGGSLWIDASSTVNRVGDAVPISMHSGNLALAGIDETTKETVGAISGAGYSTITLSSTTANAATVLDAAELRRVNRGTMLLHGNTLTVSTATTGARLLVRAEPEGLTGGGGTGALSSIVPWMIGDSTSTGAGSTLVTYSASEGLRPLLTSEYATWSTATAQSNVRLTASASLGAVNTINSLVLAGGSLTAGGTLKVSSGTILATATTVATIAPALNFGSTEANVFAVGPLTINGSISGTGGLTKSGTGTLTLGGNNSFTGPLTINAGRLSFSTANQLGADTSPIVLSGSGVTLTYTGTGAFSLARGLQLGAGISEIEHNSTGSGSIKFTVDGPISGPGGLRLDAFSTTGTRVFELTGANTYTGPTRITGTAYAIVASDVAFGNGGALELATSGTLSLAGNWQTNRSVVLTGGGGSTPTTRINTDAFTASLNGPVSGTAALVKSGTGTLKLRGDSEFSGTVRVDAGTLELSGTGAVRSTGWTLTPGTTLAVDNTDTARDERISRSATFTLDGSRISLTANAQTSTTENWNRVTLSGTNTIALTAPGNAGITLRLSQVTGTGANPMLLVRGDNLGGGPQGGWTRIVPQILGVVSGAAGGMDFAPGVYLADPVTGAAAGFVINDRSTDSAGQIGLRGIRSSEFVTGTIRNPENGGTTETSAHVLVANPVSASGAANMVRTVTLQPGGTLTLTGGQTLTVESGSIFAQTGGSSSITGGTLDLGRYRGQVYTAGDLLLGSGIVGTGTLVKLGPGTLSIGGAAQHANTDIRTGEVRLTQGGSLSGSVTVNAGSTLAVESSTASVGTLLGNGAVTISNGNQLTIGTSDVATSFSGVISGPGRLIVTGGPSGNGLRTFSGANTFTGGLTLKGGRLVIGNSAALGTGPVTMAGGILATTTSEVAISNSFVLDQALIFEGNRLLTLNSGSTLSGGGAIEVRGPGGLTVEGTSTHTGETRITYLGSSPIATREPLTISGANGSVASSSAIRLAPGTSMVLDNATAAVGLPAGRIGDSAPVELSGAQLRLTGNATVTVQETIGTLRGSGFSTVTIAPATASTSTTLSSAALERNGRGTFLFREPSGSQITFTAAPAGLIGGGGTGQNVSILPYVVGDTSATGSGSGLVTFEPGVGVRPLTAAEYVGDFANATATSNIRLTNFASLNSDITVNALVLGGSGFNNSGTTRITSGAIVKTGQSNIAVGSPIEFGTAEGNIYVGGDTQPSLELPGIVSGSNGLTKSGNGSLRLTGNNTFTGPLTINAGVLEFSQIASLGADTSPIIMHGGETMPRLRYGGTVPATLTRDVNVLSGTAALAAYSQLTISGTISGQGGISILPQSTADAEVVLTGINTYSGPTFVYGDLAIKSDASLGTNSRLVLFSALSAKGGLRLLGPWNSSRTVEVNGFDARINTNGFDARLDGPVTSSTSANIALTKAGTGTLTLTADSSYNGPLTVEGGVVRLVEGGRIASTKLNLSGGELLLDNTVTPISDRLSGVIETNPRGGSFTLLGHPTQPVSEDLGSFQYGGETPTILTLSAPGTATTSLQLSRSVGPFSPLLVRGDRLGEPSGGAGVTRVRILGTPTLQSGLLPGVVVDHSLTGLGNSFATYDTSVDPGGGVVGVRALRANEYVTGPVIQTVVNGGTVATDANYLLDGSTMAVGAVTKLNSITFAGSAMLSLTGTQRLDLSGAAGLLAQRGANAVVEGGVIGYGKPSLLTPLHVYGDGNLTFSGSLIQNAPDVGNQPLHKSGGGTLTFKNSIVRNNLEISSGAVRVEGNSDLIGSEINLEKGGTLEVGSPIARTGPIEGAGTIQVGSNTLQIYGTQSDFAGDIVGNGRVEARGSYLIPHSPLSFAGTIGVSRDPAREYQTEGVGSRYIFFSDEGSALAASGISVGPGAGFAVDARSGVQRVGAVPVAINGGDFTFRSELLDGLSKLNVGPVSAQGVAGLSASQLWSGTGAHLEVARLDRTERGIFRIGLDSSTSLNKQSRITVAEGIESVLVGAGTTATNRPIVPFAVYSGFGFTESALMTYEAGRGLRALNRETEYSYTLVAGDNVILNGSHETPAAGVKVNTLSMNGTVSGNGALQIESGMVLGNGTISSPLKFGAAEGLVYPSGLTVTGEISGTNGLTVTSIVQPSVPGGSELALRGQNTFTGPLTINDASVRFYSAENLGPDQSQIVSNDGSLIYAGDQPFTLARPMRTSGFQANLETAGTGKLTLAGAITGPGGLRIRGDVALTGTNSYEGYTVVEGRLTIASDAALGTGPLRIGESRGVPPLVSGTIALAGDWTTDRIVQIGYSSSRAMRIDTAGFNATLNGVLTQDLGLSSRPKLEKIGAGTLLLRNAAEYYGDLAVTEGTVAIDGSLGSFGSLEVGINGRLAGIGSVPRSVTVQGTLDPGLADPGLLTTGNLTFSDGATLALQLTSATQYDRLEANGSVLLNGSTKLVLDFLFDPVDFVDSFVLLANDGADAIGGAGYFTLDGNPLEEGEAFFAGTQEFRISYTGGNGNDVVLFAVPEPASVGLLAIGFGALSLTRFRRRSRTGSRM